MPSFYPSLLPRLNFTHKHYLLPCSGMEGQGMGTVISSSQTASTAPPSSGGRLSHSSHSKGGSSPLSSPKWALPMGCSSSQIALLWPQVLPVHLFSVSSSLNGVTNSARSLLYCGLSTGIHLLWCGCPPKVAGGSLLPCGSTQVAEAQLPPHDLQQRLGKSLLEHPEHLLPPPSALTLVSTGLFLLTPLVCGCNCTVFVPRPHFLTVLSQSCYNPSLMSSVLASSRSILAPASLDSIRHRGSFC